MSNIALWDKAIANNKTVTICEDDAIFNNHFEERAEDLLKGLPKDWDIIFWGFNFNFRLLRSASGSVAMRRYVRPKSNAQRGQRF